MPPKVRITKESIISTAVNLVRREGVGAINARAIATELKCSTQPVFFNFATMEALRYAVVDAADALYREYTRKEMESEKYPTYKATGMAYIRFAREEKELFKLLFMRDRSAEAVPIDSKQGAEISAIVHHSTGFCGQKAELFHLEMWAYVHGIATMMATNYLELDTGLVSEMLTDAYQGMRKRYEGKA